MGFFRGFEFGIPIYALYLQEQLFTILNLTLMFSIYSFSILISEMPSGVIADLFGRKKTLILSNCFALIAIIFLSIGGSIFMFMLNAIFNGVGNSFQSGTDTAII